jgi:hypothetical protein
MSIHKVSYTNKVQLIAVSSVSDMLLMGATARQIHNK